MTSPSPLSIAPLKEEMQKSINADLTVSGGLQVQASPVPDLFMVFDVESIGLHGEGFAVGYVVVNRAGETLEEADMSCSPFSAQGEPKNLQWVQENVPTMAYEYFSPYELREAFWQVWMRWKAQGAVLVADCCWPVEARFLAACIDNAGGSREWEGPYPLHDLASFLLAHGKDPLAMNERLPRELPAHHPLNDARQSARLLLANLAVGGGLQVQEDAPLAAALTNEEFIEKAMQLADDYARLQSVAEGEGFFSSVDVTNAEQDAEEARGELEDHLREFGCTRSHPHENMSAACERLTVMPPLAGPLLALPQ